MIYDIIFASFVTDVSNLKQLIAYISLCAVGIFIIFVLDCEKNLLFNVVFDKVHVMKLHFLRLSAILEIHHSVTDEETYFGAIDYKFIASR